LLLQHGDEAVAVDHRFRSFQRLPQGVFQCGVRRAGAQGIDFGQARFQRRDLCAGPVRATDRALGKLGIGAPGDGFGLRQFGAAHAIERRRCRRPFRPRAFDRGLRLRQRGFDRRPACARRASAARIAARLRSNDGTARLIANGSFTSPRSQV
jgi:hypothetical protein